VVKPNFVHPDLGVGTGAGGYALFVGRLSPEKGVQTLLDAWQRLGDGVPLKIVGDGPLAGQVREAQDRIPAISYLGRRPLAEVLELVGAARCLVCPSEWYEGGLPRVVLEALSRGTPIVASRLGSLADFIQHEHTGLYFRPGDSAELAAQVQRMAGDQIDYARMRQEARAEFEARYTAGANYELLMNIYRSCAASHNG